MNHQRAGKITASMTESWLARLQKGQAPRLHHIGRSLRSMPDNTTHASKDQPCQKRPRQQVIDGCARDFQVPHFGRARPLIRKDLREHDRIKPIWLSSFTTGKLAGGERPAYKPGEVVA
jgi:hypothetical protein